MSFYRQRWRLALDGFDEPVEVTTSARDSQSIVIPAVDGQPQMPMGMPLKIVHNALMRNEVEGIPRDFQKFLDIVDDADEIPDDAGAEAVGDLDPTQSALSGG